MLAIFRQSNCVSHNVTTPPLASAVDQFDIVSTFNMPMLEINFLTNVSALILQLGAIWVFLLVWALRSVGEQSILSTSNFVVYNLVNAGRRMFESNSDQTKDAHFFAMFAMFYCIFTANFFGLIPFTATATSYIAVTLFFSGISFFSNLYLSFRVFGFAVFGNLIPAGTPTALRGFMVLVETISFVTRLFSMAIRLFANMVAGHAMLKVMVAIIWSMFAAFGPLSGVGLVFAMLLLMAVTCLEMALSFLQAYVFVLLGGVYMNEAVSGH